MKLSSCDLIRINTATLTQKLALEGQGLEPKVGMLGQKLIIWDQKPAGITATIARLFTLVYYGALRLLGILTDADREIAELTDLQQKLTIAQTATRVDHNVQRLVNIADTRLEIEALEGQVGARREELARLSASCEEQTRRASDLESRIGVAGSAQASLERLAATNAAIADQEKILAQKLQEVIARDELLARKNDQLEQFETRASAAKTILNAVPQAQRELVELTASIQAKQKELDDVRELIRKVQRSFPAPASSPEGSEGRLKRSFSLTDATPQRAAAITASTTRPPRASMETPSRAAGGGFAINFG